MELTNVVSISLSRHSSVSFCGFLMAETTVEHAENLGVFTHEVMGGMT